MPVIYFLVGQAGWFACVLSAAHGWPVSGAVVVAILLIAHLLRAARPLEELKLLGVVVVLGAIWESALVRLHILAYPSGMLVDGFAPYWIVALWALFAAQFNTSYTWMRPHPMAAAALGAIAGPLSFRAGAALGAVRFEYPIASFATLAAGWAIILPVICRAARRWDGVRASRP